MGNGEQARRRAEELARRIAEPPTPRTQATADEAAQRLAEARERLRHTQLSAAAAHDQTAKAHDQAAAAG